MNRGSAGAVPVLHPMKIRIHPRVRYITNTRLLLSSLDSQNKWGEWILVDISALVNYLNYWWPMLQAKQQDGYIICVGVDPDEWFRTNYLWMIDHTIEMNGKWRSGIDKKGNLVY